MRFVGVKAICVVAAMSVGPAWATDLPMPYKARPVVTAAPALYSWTGFYAGVNLGGGWVKTDDSDTFSAAVGGGGAFLATPTTSASYSGVVGGAIVKGEDTEDNDGIVELDTVTVAGPGKAVSVAEIAAMSCVALTKVVVRGLPFHCTTELLM